MTKYEDNIRAKTNWYGSFISLAFDLGTETGLSVCRHFASDSMRFHGSRNVDFRKYKRPELFNEVSTAFNGVLDVQRGHTLVFYEEVQRWSGGAAARRYGGLLACLEMVCHSQGVELLPVAIRSVKMSFTGDGNASKAKMIDRAGALTGESYLTDNEADAIGISHYVDAIYQKGQRNG